MYDVIIIGKGPAGVSVALYTARASLKTLLIGIDNSALMRAAKIENYYGVVQISGEELFKTGLEQAKKLGVEILDEEVIAINTDKKYSVMTTRRMYEGRTVLLATGQRHSIPKIEKILEFEGKGVSYCAICDGFFYQGMKVGVIGYKDYAFHEALELQAITSDITIFTNGNELKISDNNTKELPKYKIEKRRITRLHGSDFLEAVVFEDDEKHQIDGIFVAYGNASSVDFAKRLGVMVEGNSIITDKSQRTNIEGVFAAGDCTGGFKQISIAVGQGALAAKGIINYLRKKKTGG